MLANLAMSLFEHERITTTTPKAKELRPYAEKLITLAKRGDLHSRRLAARVIGQEAILNKLFSELAPRFAERASGYTRIVQIGPRPGDNAPLAFIELVDAAEAEVEEYTPETASPALDEASVEA
jgi:large subunit ribosomal protein L17